MKPGQGVGGAPEAAAKPRKKYGLPSGVEQRTVIMSPDGSASAADSMAAAAASEVLASHPSSQNLQPPEIELVQHEIPRDSPYDSRLVLLAEPDSEQAAAFRVLRHHVLGAGHPQVIAVSGPHDGCGKTTTAINLAMALAECGRANVLLVDANLRNPKIASAMRFVPPWCFSSQLEKHRDQPFTPWGFVEIAHTGLHVAAIDPRGDKRPRLDAPAFTIAMERLRLGPYEHIIVDCPSVIGNADVNLIQDATDGVLLAARTKHVTARDVRNAVDQLTPTKILGTTLFES
jgi:Mrp family chromosome partitioning ATPase